MIELPTERKKVETYNPKLIVLFGKPKCGKSSIMSHLENNLIVDLEDGYRSLPAMVVNANNVEDLREIVQAVQLKNKEKGSYFYKYITIDNATRLEEMCLPLARDLYQNTPMGANFGWLKDANGKLLKDANGKLIKDPKADVRVLPNGAGYLHTRRALNQIIDAFTGLSETLILIAHTKDKQINKDGQEMNEMSVDLAGKMADIICGKADAVGFIYREKNKTYISFEGGDNTIKEARPLHLRGKKFEVITSNPDGELTIDTSKVFLEQ